MYARGRRLKPMTPQDQWYYLDGSETRGPVPSSQIVQLIRAGSLSPASQVAQAGWPQWSPASTALAHLLGGQPVPGPTPVAPGEPPTYAIKIHCVSGPDAGKAYMVGASEVSLGRVSGIGQLDPQVAENHVALSWQNNVLHFRTFGGARLRVAGMDVTQGALSNGQQFQMGASIWQVGAAPVELTNLLGSLASRLNKLTSTEKLEGFSLTAMFSEVFKGRKPGEIEDYFVVGTTKTTPPIDEVQTGWPKPWFFMRVLLFMLASYYVLTKILDLFENPKVIPGLMVVGAMAAPLATAILLWELNSPRNVSFVQVLMLFCLGGVISLLFALIGYQISHLGWLGTPSAGIVEEIGKVLAVMAVVRNVKYKYTLNGIVFGAAIGAGFAAFETAGYSFENGYLVGYTLNVSGQFGSDVSGPRAHLEWARRGSDRATDRQVRRGRGVQPDFRAARRTRLSGALRPRDLDGDRGRRSVARQGREPASLRDAVRSEFHAHLPGARRFAHGVGHGLGPEQSRPGSQWPSDRSRRHRLVRSLLIGPTGLAPNPR